MDRTSHAESLRQRVKYEQAPIQEAVCEIQFKLPPPRPEATAVLLDIDVIWRGNLSISQVAERLEAVHRPHRELFEAYLLDKTRELFHIPAQVLCPAQ